MCGRTSHLGCPAPTRLQHRIVCAVMTVLAPQSNVIAHYYSDEQIERRAGRVAPGASYRLELAGYLRDALRDDLDLDDHPRFEVARHVAGKLVVPRLSKRPL